MKKKVIKLNEGDIENMVKKIIQEDATEYGFPSDTPQGGIKQSPESGQTTLTDWEKEYITEHIPGKIGSEFYWDNPSAAVEDVEWLLELVNKLK